MTVGHVQGFITAGTSGTSQTFSYSSTIGSGNLGCGFVTYDTGGSTTPPTVKDDKGNNWNVVDSVNDSAATQALTGFYLDNITNAPKTLTITFSENEGAGSVFVVADEYSGIASSPLDGHTMQRQSNPATSTDAVTSGNITTAASGDLIYSGAVDMSFGTVTLTHGTSFTLRNQGTNAQGTLSSEDLIQSMAGTTAGTWTINVQQDMVTGVMAFKAITSGTVKYKRSLSPMGARIGVRQMDRTGI